MRNQRKTGMMLSYLSQVIHIISGIMYTPIMLRLLGQSEYGLYQLVYSVVSYLSLLSFGFSSSYIRFYSRISKKNNKKELDSFNGMFMTIFIFIAIVCLLCGVVMVFNIEKIFGNGLTEREYTTARILMALMVINLTMTFPGSVFDSITAAHERFFFQKMLSVLQNLLNPFITLPLLIMGYGSIAMVLVTTGLTIAKLLVNMTYCLKKLQIVFTFKNFNLGLLKEMWIFTSFIFINLVVDQINWSVDKFLLGRLSGTIAVAIYGVGGQLNTLYLELSTSVSNVFIPKVNQIVVNADNQHELTELFTKVGRIQFMILALIMSGFILFGEYFIELWAGESYKQSYYVAITLMLPVTIPLIQNLGIEIQRAKNMHKTRSFVYLFVAISNIFLSIPLIKNYGAFGAALGTSVTLLLGNGLFMNWYYKTKVKLDIGYFWKQIVSIFPSIIFSAAVALVVRKFIPINGFVIWACEGVFYVIIYCALLWKFSMNANEKAIIVSFQRK